MTASSDMTLTRSSPATASARYTRPIALVAGAALLAPTLVRPNAHGPVLCPLRRLTGVWCPTCGMTRAVGWLLHGDLHQSLRYHPLAPLLLVEAACVAAVWWYRRPARSGGTAPSTQPAPSALVRGLIVANALLVLVVWIVRLTSGSFSDLG